MTRSIKREGDHIVIRLPVEDVHGLRVALQPCPCKGAKSNSTATIRDDLRTGLARAMAGKDKG